MKYEKIWKKVLSPGEEVKYEFSIGDRYRKFYLIVCGIIGLVLLFIPPYFIGVLVILSSIFYFGFFIRWANAYAFTNKRILIHWGWLSTELVSIDYQKITDITVDEPIIDKLITHTGHLVINTAGTSFSKLELKHIERPYEIKKKLDEIRGFIL